LPTEDLQMSRELHGYVRSAEYALKKLLNTDENAKIMFRPKKPGIKAYTLVVLCRRTKGLIKEPYFKEKSELKSSYPASAENYFNNKLPEVVVKGLAKLGYVARVLIITTFEEPADKESAPKTAAPRNPKDFKRHRASGH